MTGAARVPSLRTCGWVAGLYAGLGMGLLFVLRRATWSISIVRTEPAWYESDYMPIGAAVVVFALTALWVRLPVAWLYGLLITGPPYAWVLWLLTTAMRDASATPEEVSNAKGLVPLALFLALSGALLNPLVAATVSRITARGTKPVHKRATR